MNHYQLGVWEHFTKILLYGFSVTILLSPHPSARVLSATPSWFWVTERPGRTTRCVHASISVGFNFLQVQFPLCKIFLKQERAAMNKKTPCQLRIKFFRLQVPCYVLGSLNDFSSWTITYFLARVEAQTTLQFSYRLRQSKKFYHDRCKWSWSQSKEKTKMFRLQLILQRTPVGNARHRWREHHMDDSGLWMIQDYSWKTRKSWPLSWKPSHSKNSNWGSEPGLPNSEQKSPQNRPQ